MKKIMILSSILSLLGLQACTGVKEIGRDAFSTLVSAGDVQLVDCRTADEYIAGHMEGAVLIDYKSADFKEKALGMLDKEKGVAVYCRTGRRSRAAGEILAAEGFKVFSLAGGIVAWKEGGLPVTKALVLYYSQTGTTRAVAEEIASRTGADIASFDVTEPYDGSFDETVERCLTERATGKKPVLKAPDCDFSKYGLIFLGYPIWFGTYAPPVEALIASEKFEGKVIVPFCTFGSGGLQSSTADLVKALPEADIREGYGVRTARIGKASAEIGRFLIENGWTEGKAEPLPEYSEQVPVSEKEAAIFDEACSGYQFPLGTPVSCGSRKTADGMDYLFTAETEDLDGNSSSSTIYIEVRDGKAEFTQVVR